MFAISSDLISRLLVDSRTVSDDELLSLARKGDNKLAAILLSIWRRDRGTLRPDLVEELEAHEQRTARYRDTLEAIRAAGVYPIKGRRIAARYPPGIVRESRDLDLVAATPADAWRAAERLLARGWEIAEFMLMRIGDEERPIFALESPDVSAFFDWGDSVHLSSVGLVGDVWSGFAARPVLVGEQDSDSPAFDLLRVTAERVERQYAARDLVDAAVLLDAASTADTALLAGLLDECDLWPEWRELAERTSAIIDVPEPLTANAAAPASRAARRLRRRQRLLRGLNPWRAASSYAQLRMLERKSGRLDEVLFQRLRSRLKPTTALAYGLPLFGVPIDGGRRAASLRLAQENGALRAETPVGVFAMTAGDEVSV